MPSHPDRVRKNNCKHTWLKVFGVRKIDGFRFVLDGYYCISCDATISEHEYNKLFPRPTILVASSPIDDSYKWIKDKFVNDYTKQD